MTSRQPLIVRTLNAALGLDLADFAEAREFIRSPEGAEILDAWLESHPDDSGDTNEPVTKFTNDSVTGCARAEADQPGLTS